MSALSTAAAQAAAQAADPKVISGTAIAKAIRLEIKAEVVAMAAAGPKVPGLAVILVGSRPDSQSYVRMKKKACAEAGINSYGFDYPVTVTEAELVAKVGGNALQCEYASNANANANANARMNSITLYAITFIPIFNPYSTLIHIHTPPHTNPSPPRPRSWN